MEKYLLYEDYDTFKPLDRVPSCMLLHLKKVYFFTYKTSALLTLVRYLLQNSEVLEIFFAGMNDCGFELEKFTEDEVLNCPRASPLCEIKFVDFNYSDKLKLEHAWV